MNVMMQDRKGLAAYPPEIQKNTYMRNAAGIWNCDE